MKTFENKIYEILDKIPVNTIQWTIVFLCVGQLIFDFEYMFDPFFESLGIPRLSTIINFVFLPLFVVLLIIKMNKNNYKPLIAFILYGIILLIYLITHIAVAGGLVDKLYLTTNFYFSAFKEITYVMTLVIPLFLVYLVYKTGLSDDCFEFLCISSSALTALPIFVSNIFKFGISTYTGETTYDTFLSWYALPFDKFTHHPRMYACKFFFTEGNTIGILMFCILPFILYYVNKYKHNKIKRWLYSILAFIHALSMIILGTRIGTYGAFLVPAMMLCIYFVMLILKEEKLNYYFIIVCIVITCFSAFTYKYSPANQNQLIGNNDNKTLLANQANVSSDDKVEMNKLLGNYKELMGDIEYQHSLIYAFEQYSWMINNTPEQYYLYYYNYKFDPGFWLDYAFNVPFEGRLNGRQTQMIFQTYKWNTLNDFEKAMGMGYTTFMNGSFIIEKDFVRQFFSFGYLGFVILMCPWIILYLYAGIKMLFNRKTTWNFLNITLLASISLCFASAYTSGHTMDQYVTNLFLAIMFGILFYRIRLPKKES